jgi:anti-sigma-K factor RskA
VTPDEARDLLAAYALNALPADEAREVEAHVRASDALQRELAAFQDVAATLATGVPAVDPPASLRARIMAAIEPQAITPRVSEPRAIEPPGRVVAFPRVWAMGFAAAAALAVVLAGVAVSLTQRVAALNRQMTALTERLGTQEQVLALLANPSTKTAALSGRVQARVRFVYDPERRQGALVVTDLDDPGSEFVYQLWLVAGQQPESAGVFRPTPGRPIIVPVAADFARYQVVAISVERGPSGSSRGPTSNPVLAASL